MNVHTMTAIIERQRVRLYTKIQKNCKTFLYTKIMTLFKKLDNSRYVVIYKKAIHLTLRDFHEIFEVGIYTQKS